MDRFGVMLTESDTKKLMELVRYSGREPYSFIAEAIAVLHNVYMEKDNGSQNG